MNPQAAAIVKAIKEAEIITLFHHVYPDHDAYGSQLGLKKILQDKYPDKQIYAIGFDALRMDTADDSTIENSLAILLDCSTSNRIEDDRWKKAAKTARIDHHVKAETFADLEWIDEDATATCEMVTLLAKELGSSIPKEAAQDLYEGLIADNLRFSVDKTRPESFEAGAYLVENGANVVQAAKSVFATNYLDFTYENKVRQKSTRLGNLLFSVMDVQDWLSAGIGFSKAKEKVFALADIDEIEVWALFTQMEDGIHYSASLRSKTRPIRPVAAEYGGGGHDCASGIKNLSAAQVFEIIEKLEQIAA